MYSTIDKLLGRESCRFCSLVTAELMLRNLIHSVTKREPEAKETWRAQDDSVKQAIQNSEVAEWEFGGSELIKNSEHIVKVCCVRFRGLSVASDV